MVRVCLPGSYANYTPAYDDNEIMEEVMRDSPKLKKDQPLRDNICLGWYKVVNSGGAYCPSLRQSP